MMFHSFSFILTIFVVVATARATFPTYSQQCRDDAGPPYEDDEEIFGSGNKYFSASAAEPILNENGMCPTPLRDTCNTGKSKLDSYLEGPINCNNEGWYCRILNDEENGWEQINLISDYNFGFCNTSDAFAESGYDRDGHCHGSDDDSTYYWWIRDHWFRQYNGRLRCCCGWDTAVKSGTIVNRCDFRRVVSSTENLENCRDPNEDHSLSYEGGCDESLSDDKLGNPIEEDDDQCWEISRYGYNEEFDLSFDDGDLLDCFSPNTMVQVLLPTESQNNSSGPTIIPMEQIQVGDKVMTGSGTYKTIYTIDHHHPTRQTKFLQIHHRCGSGANDYYYPRPFEVTKRHLVFIDDNLHPIPAASLNVGDRLKSINTYNSFNYCTVTNIVTITRNGFYNPITADGTIVVGGSVIVSTYSALSEQQPALLFSQSLSYQEFIHTLMQPYKYICSTVSLDLCKTENERIMYSSLGAQFYYVFKLCTNKLLNSNVLTAIVAIYNQIDYMMFILLDSYLCLVPILSGLSFSILLLSSWYILYHGCRYYWEPLNIQK